MNVTKFILGIFETNSYIVEDNDFVILIDAPDNLYPIIEELNKKNLKPDALLLTHGHLDHIYGLDSLLSSFSNLPIYLAKEDQEKAINGNKDYSFFFSSFYSQKEFLYPYLDYKEEIFSFRVLRTPGHTKGSICLYNAKDKILFSGDTLFFSGYGRTDLGGNIEEERESISTLLSLPSGTLILPGHGDNTTIERELGF